MSANNPHQEADQEEVKFDEVRILLAVIYYSLAIANFLKSTCIFLFTIVSCTFKQEWYEGGKKVL